MGLLCVYYTFLVCMCVSAALDMQHAKVMHRLRPTSSSAACPVLPLFFFLSNYLIWKKELVKIKCVIQFYLQLLSETSHSKKNSATYYRKCTQILTLSNRYSCQILMKLEFSWQAFEKSKKYTFHENPSSGSMRTDGQKDMTKVIFFRDFANAPKNNGQVRRLQNPPTELRQTHQEWIFIHLPV